MTNLARLRVSLTKHGAHKLSELIRQLPISDVLNSTIGVVDGVNIAQSQARVILSADRNGELPAIWSAAKASGEKTVRALVFLAIAFSHVDLIAALKAGTTSNLRGTIRRDMVDGGKGFTNFKDDVFELGFSIDRGVQHVSYNLTSIIKNPQLPPLALELFRLKLLQAGWDEKTALLDECVALGFHNALAITENQFREWLTLGGEQLAAASLQNELDETANNNDNIYASLGFRSGHNRKKIKAIRRAARYVDRSIELAHNEIQSKIYGYLCELHGEDRVGTEVGPVDIVCEEDDGRTYYELKVGDSIRLCIREALPQLLEYAFWPDDDRANILVIVSPCKPTDASKKYMKLLREKFHLPIYYRQVDSDTGELLEKL